MGKCRALAPAPGKTLLRSAPALGSSSSSGSLPKSINFAEQHQNQSCTSVIDHKVYFKIQTWKKCEFY